MFFWRKPDTFKTFFLGNKQSFYGAFSQKKTGLWRVYVKKILLIKIPSALAEVAAKKVEG
jgi:hypothetical protein